jgi:hypothetical protein
MSDVRERLAARSVSGTYGAFLGIGAGLAVLGIILAWRSAAMGASDRVWQLIHVNYLFFTSLAFGSVGLAAAQKIARAKWSGVVLRFAEAAVAFLPLSLVILVLIFVFGYDAVYGPMHAQLPALSPGKALWLSKGFMFCRMFFGTLILTWVGWRLVKHDMLPDVYLVRRVVAGGRRSLYEKWSRTFDGSESAAEANEARVSKWAGIYSVVYAIVMSILAFDGVMALQPHWYSNLLGGYYFMGAFLASHMLLALLMMYGAANLGISDLVSPKQRHDLGKLCFGFTVFWAYLMWAQFLVIWYGNMPEETGFVFARLWGHWLIIGKLVFIGMFLVPFIGLLGVVPKKQPVTLGLFASVSLIAFWLERYLLVAPSVSPLPGPAFGVPDLAPTFLLAGLFLLSYAVFARTFPMVSPRLAMITINRELGHHAVETFDHEDHDKDFLHQPKIEGA